MKLTEQFTRARNAGVPLVGVTTPDALACIEKLSPLANDHSPHIYWDCIKGLGYCNEEGKEWLSTIDEPRRMGSRHPDKALEILADAPEDAVVFMVNIHMFLHLQTVLQGICNLRDPYKGRGAMLVLLSPQLMLPPELRDVVVFDDPLPTPEEIKNIITNVYNQTDEKLQAQGDKGLPKLKNSVFTQTSEKLRGLSCFIAEQSFAMGLSKDGVDQNVIWEQKKQTVKQIRGLSVDEGIWTFDDMGGNAAIKEFGHKLFNGAEPPFVVVRVEEIEKKMGTEGPDAMAQTSDVSSDALDVILNGMEDNKWGGVVCVGPPGTGKSFFAQCLATTFGALGVCFDVNATRSKYVGESELYIREAIKSIYAMGGSNVFFVATANDIKTLPPALRRRFWMGVYYFDMPDEIERAAIWKICLARRNRKDKINEIPNDEGWTGAEIRNCVEFAYRFSCSLEEASKYIVPIATSDPEGVERLRKYADGRLLSAAYKGKFRIPTETNTEKARKVRVQ